MLQWSSGCRRAAAYDQMTRLKRYCGNIALHNPRSQWNRNDERLLNQSSRVLDPRGPRSAHARSLSRPGAAPTNVAAGAGVAGAIEDALGTREREALRLGAQRNSGPFRIVVRAVLCGFFSVSDQLKLAYEAVARVLHLLGLMPRVLYSFVG